MIHATLSAKIPMAVASLLIAGCAVGPNFEKPAAPDVSDYTASPFSTTVSSTDVAGGEAQRFAKGMDISADWWTLFHSRPLNDLIEQSLTNNHDLKAAQAALSVARENVRAQRGVFYPNVSASFSANRQKQSGAFAPTPSTNALQFSLFTPQLSVSYVPDVFGLNRRTAESLHQGVPQKEADQAETDATNAEADRDAALQGLVSLDVDPQAITEIQQGRPISRAQGVIRSPIAGTVVERLITPGQLLQAGTTPCFTVADLSRVWVMAQIFGADIASVSLGAPADIMTGIGSTNFSGTVGNIAALVDPNTRSVAVRVVVDNRGEALKKQMYVRVLIHARQDSDGFLVPASAILRDDENLPFVYVVQADGSYARQHVTLGYRTGDQYDIVEGLKAGDRIVTEGGIFVQFMQNQ